VYLLAFEGVNLQQPRGRPSKAKRNPPGCQGRVYTLNGQECILSTAKSVYSQQPRVYTLNSQECILSTAKSVHSQHYKQYQFCPRKNGNLGGGKYINFPEDFLQNDSGVKIRLK
jgi:hypothetical protein